MGAPRCGTTRIYEVFQSHPDVSVCARKEPYYFSPLAYQGHFKDITKPIQDLDEYLRLFDFTTTSRYYAETSTTYCWDPESPGLIHKTSPDSKIIFILRDPANRFYSHYLHHFSRYQERRSLKAVLNAGVNPNASTWDAHVYQSGLYSRNIERYLDIFQSNQVLVLKFEDIMQHPDLEFQKLSRFLDVEFPFDTLVSDKKVNAQHVRRSSFIKYLHNLRNLIYPKPLPLPSWLKKGYQKHLLLPKMSKEDRAAIEASYKADQIQLKQLLGWNYLEA